MIRFYDSVEEMFAAEEANQKAAAALIKEWQRGLTPGDCFIRQAHGVTVYCEVLEPSEEEDKEMYATGDYRFCRAYSEYCPDGEYGDVHISTAVQGIDRVKFDEALTNLRDPE